MFSEFGRGGGFTRALQTDHQNGDRRGGFKADRGLFGSQRIDQRIMDDFDDHLAGRDRFDDFGTDSATAHLVDEGAHHIERHIGFDQGKADFAQRSRHIGFRQRTAACQPVQDTGEFV